MDWQNNKVAICVGMVLSLFWIIAIWGGVYWWNYNRMDFFFCFFDHSSWMDEQYERWAMLVQHTSRGKCAPLDKEKHWLLMEKASTEWNWETAHFFMALKHGYGDFFNESLDDIFEIHYHEQFKLNPFNVLENERIIHKVREDFGDGQNLNYEKSLHLLQKSAEGDMGLAKRILSYAYYTGEWGKDGKIKKDIVVSTYWLEFDAKICSPLFYAGYRYRYGTGENFLRNDRKAYYYFNKAYEAIPKDITPQVFCINAIVELARMYAEGIGVEKNVQKAESLLDEASEIVLANQHHYSKYMPHYVRSSKEKILTLTSVK